MYALCLDGGNLPILPVNLPALGDDVRRPEDDALRERPLGRPGFEAEDL